MILVFQERADYRSPHLYAEYLNVNSDLFRFYLLWAYGGYAWNFDGDMIMNFYSSGEHTFNSIIYGRFLEQQVLLDNFMMIEAQGEEQF
ncbi:MAG: hypothetical protein BalsKO_08370 [Balneolaceae bacterium]